MADPKQLDLLRHSIEEWNTWRKQHPETTVDLVDADLISADLRLAKLNGAKLNRAKLHDADLISADLSVTDLSHANLSHANLSFANLSMADLRLAKLSFADLSMAEMGKADLRHAHLRHANLYEADFREANLSRADLREADLSRADLCSADLNDADLREATIGITSFGDRDFRQMRGLDTIKHLGPSQLSINSIYLSAGILPETFVRGTGAPDTFLEYMRALTARPIEYYTCFISYSNKDQPFAERLYADLQHNGVRCWFAPHDMRIGDEIRTRIDASIRMYDKLLLVLSHHAITSSWVKKEVETAFEKEDQHKKLVLFPVRLDETVMETQQAWAADIRRMRHIGDFTRWKDHDAYQQGLQRLLRDLKQEKV